MRNKNASGASTFEVLSIVLMTATLMVGAAALVANWLSVPGFPYHPFHRAPQPTTLSEPIVTAAPPAAPPSSTTSHRTTKPSRSAPQQQQRRDGPDPQSVVEARTMESAAAPAPITRRVTSEMISRPAIEDREPTAHDGSYRGTIVDCQQASNVPGSAAKLCIDIGGSVVSAAMDGHLYVLVGGWIKRIPLNTGDSIRFEVRHGEVSSAELLSDPHGR